jgi:hypothetical protein
MDNYSNSVIYNIICINQDIKEKYIGSTIDFDRRCIKHRSDCYNEKMKYYHYDVYKFIRDNGGIDNFEIKIIQNYSCNNDLELRMEEQRHIDLGGGIDNLLNKYNAYSTKENNRKVKQKWAKEHPDRMRIADNKYWAKNPDKKKAKDKRYYEKHKEQILAKSKELYKCECGSTIQVVSKSKHVKTIKHQAFIN